MGLTPGTPLMAEIERSLEFYICQRLQKWRHLQFELSGARVQVIILCSALFNLSYGCALALAHACIPGPIILHAILHLSLNVCITA